MSVVDIFDRTQRYADIADTYTVDGRSVSMNCGTRSGRWRSNAGSIVEVQHWLGHADTRTTSRYLHRRSRGDEARRLRPAFQVAQPEGVEEPVEEER
jgi:hypothetical protein